VRARPLSFAILLFVTMSISGCGGKRKRAAAKPFDAGVSPDASREAEPAPPPPPAPPPVECARVGLTDEALTAALGRPARVLPEAAGGDHGPPRCAIELGAGGVPPTVMIDCTVRGGQADKVMATLRADADYTALAELGKQALATPGQLVFVDDDTECLVTVSGAALAQADLLVLARLAERGVAPGSVW
jgi:hypothetical protein